MTPIETFKQKAPGVMSDLMHDFGLTDYQAAGILGNIGVECLGFTALREIGQPEGLGGYGWAQWTGRRAMYFDNFCDGRKLDWKTDEANYAFLKAELSGSIGHNNYAIVIHALKGCLSYQSATQVFEAQFEHAGVVAMKNRVEWACIALTAYRAAIILAGAKL